MKDRFDEQAAMFKQLVAASYDHIYAHPEDAPVVDDLVNWVSARFSNEPSYAVVLAVWNAINNCTAHRINPIQTPPTRNLLQ